MSYWSNHDPENFSRELDRQQMEFDKRMDMLWWQYECEQANLLLTSPQNQNLFIVDGEIIEGKSINQL